MDTCVWIDLAGQYNQRRFLESFAHMVGGGMVGLVVPRKVVDEFEGKKKEIIEGSNKGFSDVVRRVRQVAGEIGDAKRNKQLFKQLADIEYKAGQNSEHTVLTGIDVVERLFANSTIIETSKEVIERCSERAMNKLAPFHRGKNSFNDAILIETYADQCCGAQTGDKLAFVTHNTKDFSEVTGDRRCPHPDIASYFASPNSTYSISLLDTVRELEPGIVDEFQGMVEWSMEPRRLSEIVEAGNMLLDKIWYDRHMVLRHKVETGRIRIISAKNNRAHKAQRNIIQADVWKGALAAGARLRKKYGAKNLGPYSKFDWGMMNGKLSALNWVMGEDWDMLDT